MHLKAVTLKSLEYEHKTLNFPVKYHRNGLTKLLEIYFLIPDNLFWYFNPIHGACGGKPPTNVDMSRKCII